MKLSKSNIAMGISFILSLVSIVLAILTNNEHSGSFNAIKAFAGEYTDNARIYAYVILGISIILISMSGLLYLENSSKNNEYLIIAILITTFSILNIFFYGLYFPAATLMSFTVWGIFTGEKPISTKKEQKATKEEK